GTIDMKNILSLVDVGLGNFILPKDWVFFAFFGQIPQLNQGILVFFKVRKLSYRKVYTWSETRRRPKEPLCLQGVCFLVFFLFAARRKM
ncbi:hypothetical protein, partial [Caldalkalibacillus thermarum]|uniref:hypothetical protein n=1 Tax=Caldalkalibacillus thermarum TaxID=296745 RepID=UPI001E44746C